MTNTDPSITWYHRYQIHNHLETLHSKVLIPLTFKNERTYSNEWLYLALKLFPDDSAALMRVTLTNILRSPREAGFLARDDDGRAIAFINLSLRYEYVPGATQNPVAYIEGIYVLDEYRKSRVGTALITFAEQWAIEHRCAELASDALIENTVSYEFHTKVGFREVERVVFFIKPVVAPD